jgi:hypothetical protein
MAAMSSAQRAETNADLMSELSSEREVCAVTEPDLRAAIDAADQWISDNATSYNNALPVAARNNLTASQKARLLMHVIRKRFVVGA